MGGSNKAIPEDLMQAIAEKGKAVINSNSSPLGSGSGIVSGIGSSIPSSGQPVPELNHATLMGLAENLRTGNIILDVVLMTLVSALLKFFLDLIRWENISRLTFFLKAQILRFLPQKKQIKSDKPMNHCIINLEYKQSDNGDIWFENNFVKYNETYFLAMYHFLSENASEMRGAELNITYDRGTFRKPWDLYRNYQVGARPLSTLEIDGFYISYSENTIKPNIPKILEDDGKTDSTQKAIREFIHANRGNTIQKKIIVESKKSTEKIMEFIDKIYQDYLDKKYPVPPQKPQTKPEIVANPRYYFCRQQGSQESYERYELHVKKTFSTLYFPRKEKLLKRLDRFAAGQTTSGKFTILLHGPPGGGKTSFIKALCNYTECHVINIKLSQFANLQQLMNIFHKEYLWIPEIEDRMYIPINKRIYLFEDIDCDNNKIVLKRSEDQEKQIKEYLRKQRRKSNKNHKKKHRKHSEKKNSSGDGEKQAVDEPDKLVVEGENKGRDKGRDQVRERSRRARRNKKKGEKSEKAKVGRKGARSRKSSKSKDMEPEEKKTQSKKQVKHSGSSSYDSDYSSDSDTDSESDTYYSDSDESICSSSSSGSMAGLCSDDNTQFYGSFARSKYTSSAPTNPLEAPSLSLAGILNLLDGVLELNGCYIVMTTNHKEKLDRALTRPGRVNYEQELTYIEQTDMYQMIQQYVPNYRRQLRHLGEESCEKTALVSKIEEQKAKKVNQANNAQTKLDTVQNAGQSMDNQVHDRNDRNDRNDLDGMGKGEGEGDGQTSDSSADSSADEEMLLHSRVKLYSPEWERQQMAQIRQKISEQPELFSSAKSWIKTLRSTESGSTRKATTTEGGEMVGTETAPKPVKARDLFKDLLKDIEKLQTMPCMFETICQNEDHILEIINNIIDNIIDRELERKTSQIRAKEYEQEQKEKKEREKRKAQSYKTRGYPGNYYGRGRRGMKVKGGRGGGLGGFGHYRYPGGSANSSIDDMHL